MTAAHIAGLKGDHLECLHLALKACDEEMQAKAILNYIFTLPDLDKSLAQSCLEQVSPSLFAFFVDLIEGFVDKKCWL